MSTTLGKWTIKRTLGEGASCKVKLAVDPLTKEYAAIKIMKENMNDQDKALLMTEVEAMMKMKHENVLQIIDFG